MKNQAKHFQEQSLTVVPYQKEGQSASHYKIHKHKHTQNYECLCLQQYRHIWTPI